MVQSLLMDFVLEQLSEQVTSLAMVHLARIDVALLWSAFGFGNAHWWYMCCDGICSTCMYDHLPN